MKATWIDRAAGFLSPKWELSRLRARAARALLLRHYEAAAGGRRTMGWRSSPADVNSLTGPVLAPIRERARDLVRNNAYAESALSTICDQAVGWGIVAKPEPMNKPALALWKEWAETTACDADGRHDIYGLQKLVMRTVVESGEVLVRRRFRRPEDGLPIPLQLQVIDPDFLDTTKDSLGFAVGADRTVQGVVFDGIGRRKGYWLFKEHPGSAMPTESVFVPASEVLHIFKPSRPGQVRAVSWFAPVLLMFKDFDEFADATLMKQKIAACLAIIETETDGNAMALGTADDTASPPIDSLEPGAIIRRGAGSKIEVVQPPRVDEFDDYTRTVLRAIATGLGVTYEDLTGDYNDMPFSAARMSRIRHWARVEDWRWRLLIPQFCDPVWAWAMQAGAIAGRVSSAAIAAEWSAPPAPMVDPVNEGLAIMRNVRAGIQSLSDALRERGMDPTTVFAEIASDMEKLDELGIILDSDPRNMTQAGQLQGEAAALAKADGEKPGAPPAEPPVDRALAHALSVVTRR